MRTRFVVHKNLLSQVFQVLPRSCFSASVKWNPEDILVRNPTRKTGMFILPKSEYVPCNKDGVVKDVETAYLAECGTQSESRGESDREVPQVA